MRSTPPVLLAQSSQILGLSNEVKHISELQVAFEKTAKNLTKFASKNLGVRKLNFPSVRAVKVQEIQNTPSLPYKISLQKPRGAEIKFPQCMSC